VYSPHIENHTAPLYIQLSRILRPSIFAGKTKLSLVNIFFMNNLFSPNVFVGQNTAPQYNQFFLENYTLVYTVGGKLCPRVLS